MATQSIQIAFHELFKPIADVADGLDANRVMRIRLDFGAERGHTAVHAAVVHDDVVAPHRIENLVAGKRAAGTLEEKLQEPEFCRR